MFLRMDDVFCYFISNIFNKNADTSLLDFSVLRFGRKRTSLKSSLMSFSIRGILRQRCAECDAVKQKENP